MEGSLKSLGRQQMATLDKQGVALDCLGELSQAINNWS